MTRDQLISTLEDLTQIDRIELKRKTEEELKRLYEERVLGLGEKPKRQGTKKRKRVR